MFFMCSYDNPTKHVIPDIAYISRAHRYSKELAFWKNPGWRIRELLLMFLYNRRANSGNGGRDEIELLALMGVSGPGRSIVAFSFTSHI